ncbi:MAG TPA: RNA polymerase sporulation sigma factor SigG [Oscillospiraceae bacterium]|nr:RNA polymerase sporulation sigma factor SigG [Oscillospiraceae bacterium]
MHFGKVEICGVDTSKLKLLTEPEKIELLEKAHKGDKKARDELVCGNLRLVLSVIQRFSNRGENPDDLFQVGCIGLMKSIDNFDTSHNVRFSTYAVPMIIGEIRRYLRDNNTVRVSRSMRDTAYKAMKVRDELTNQTRKEPTIEQVSEKLGLKKSDVVLALEAVIEPVSFYEPVYSDGGDAIYVHDQLSDGADDLMWIDEILLKESLKSLTGREKRILSLRFIQGMTQTEAAKEVGISQAQVSRLEKGVLDKIKNN